MFLDKILIFNWKLSLSGREILSAITTEMLRKNVLAAKKYLVADDIFIAKSYYFLEIKISCENVNKL